MGMSLPGRGRKNFLVVDKSLEETDNRRVYTSAAGWPVIPENDFHLVPDPRIQQWGSDSEA